MSVQIPANRAANDVYDTVLMLASLLRHVHDHILCHEEEINESPSCVAVIERVLKELGVTPPLWGSPEAPWWSGESPAPGPQEGATSNE